MKRSGFRPPTPEQLERARERKQESAHRWKAKPRKKGLFRVPNTKRGKERKRERFERAYLSEAYMDLVHSAPCAVRGCKGWPVHAAHVGKTRRNGGMWYEIAPLCPKHHAEQEGRTEAFNRKHGVDLMAIAHALAFEHMGFVA